jgi:hypothetical protein
MAGVANPFGTIISVLKSRNEVTPFGSITFRVPDASSFVNPRVSSTEIYLISCSFLTLKSYVGGVTESEKQRNYLVQRRRSSNNDGTFLGRHMKNKSKFH